MSKIHRVVFLRQYMVRDDYISPKRKVRNSKLINIIKLTGTIYFSQLSNTTVFTPVCCIFSSFVAPLLTAP